MMEPKKKSVVYNKLSARDVKQHLLDVDNVLKFDKKIPDEWDNFYLSLEQRFKKTFGGD